MNRYEATTLEGFVQQLVSYVSSGYRWYVTGRIPGRKDPANVEARLVEKFGIELSDSQRWRRSGRGEANLRLLRYGRFFVLIATPPMGKHVFYEEEGHLIRDIRKSPIRLEGYAVSSRRDGSLRRKGQERWRVHVRLTREALEEQRARFFYLAVHRRREALEEAFAAFPYEPYAPIRRQLLGILRDVNAKRKVAGYELLPTSCLRLRRRQVKPFDQVDAGEGEGSEAA